MPKTAGRAPSCLGRAPSRQNPPLLAPQPPQPADPPWVQVLGNQGLLEAALQATLTCDAISLRFQLPPHGSAPPTPTSTPAVAHSTKCIPALVTTSVWVVNLLRSLAATAANRLLPLLGIGMVGSQPVLGFSPDSAKLFALLQSQQPILGHIPQVRCCVLPHAWLSCVGLCGSLPHLLAPPWILPLLHSWAGCDSAWPGLRDDACR